MSCLSSRISGCTISLVSTNKLKFSNVFNDQITSLILTIKNIQNPYNLGTTSSLIITSFTVINSSSFSVDQSTQTDISLNLVGRKMSYSNTIISSTSDVTFAMCDLSIKVSNNNPITSNSYVDIMVPSELLLPSTVVCNFGCILLTNVSSTVRIYLSSVYSAGQLPVITFYSVRNPQSTKPTSTFAVTIYNQQGQIL